MWKHYELPLPTTSPPLHTTTPQTIGGFRLRRRWGGALLAAAVLLAWALQPDPAEAQQTAGPGLTIVSGSHEPVSNLGVTTGAVIVGKDSCTQHATSFTTGGATTDRFQLDTVTLAHDTAESKRDLMKLALYADGTGAGAGSPGAKIADLQLNWTTADRAHFIAGYNVDFDTTPPTVTEIKIELAGATTYHIVSPDVNDIDHKVDTTTSNNQSTPAIAPSDEFTGWSIGDTGKRTWGCPSSGRSWADWNAGGANYKLRFGITIQGVGPTGLQVREGNQTLTFSWDSIPTDGGMVVQFKRSRDAQYGGNVFLDNVNGEPVTSWTVPITLDNRYNYDFRVRSDKTNSHFAIVHAARPTNFSSSSAIRLLEAATGSDDGAVFLSWNVLRDKGDDGVLQPSYDNIGTNPDNSADHRRITHFAEVRWKATAAADSTYSDPVRVPVFAGEDPRMTVGFGPYDPSDPAVAPIVGSNLFVQAALVHDTQYTFQVRSDRGDGTWQSITAAPQLDSRVGDVGFRAVAGDKRLVVVWGEPKPVDDHMQYRYRKSSEIAWSAAIDGADVDGLTTRYVVATGLDNGTEYDVQARSDLGNGRWSDTRKGTPAAETKLTDLPKPANLKATLEATEGQDGQPVATVNLSWDAVTDKTSDWAFYAVRFWRGSTPPQDLRAYDGWYFLPPGYQYPISGITTTSTARPWYDPVLTESANMPALVNGLHSFQVAVVNNRYQVGPASDTVTTYVVTELDPPGNVRMTPSSGFSGANRVGGFWLTWWGVQHANLYQYRYARATGASCGTYGEWADVPTGSSWRGIRIPDGIKRILGIWPSRTYRWVYETSQPVYPAGMSLGLEYCVQARAVTGAVESDPAAARVENTGIGGSGPLAEPQWTITPLLNVENVDGLSATGGDRSATLCWDLPTDTDPNRIGIQTLPDRYAIRGWQYTFYVPDPQRGGGRVPTTWERLPNVRTPSGSPNRACSTITELTDGTGLVNGQSYRIGVRAVGTNAENFPDFEFPWRDRTQGSNLLSYFFESGPSTVWVTPSGPTP